MYKLQIHKDAQKALSKAQIRTREKAFTCIKHLRDKGTLNSPFPIAPLKGDFKKYKYFEAKIQKDYRIIFRTESDTLYIRAAGTHNMLGTG
jgi:mRNA-degrading endonuclease YafQ of YafQ-DinJ toxin-antitoxin module